MQRKGIVVAAKLIGLVLPLMHIMLGAVILGVLGFLCAIFIPVLGGYGIVNMLLGEEQRWATILIILIIIAIEIGRASGRERGYVLA